jgi:hypothetical protein
LLPDDDYSASPSALMGEKKQLVHVNLTAISVRETLESELCPDLKELAFA